MSTIVTGTLVTVILALSKVIEFIIGLVVKRHQEKNGTAPKLSLHPEVSRQIRETYEDVRLITRDLENVVKHSHTTIELVQQITEALKVIAASQEKAAGLLDRVDRRLEIQEAIDAATKRSA